MLFPRPRAPAPTQGCGPIKDAIGRILDGTPSPLLLMCHHVTPTSLRLQVLKTLFFTDRGGFKPLGYSEIICLGKAKLPATYSWSGEAGFRTAPRAVCRRGGLFDGGLAHPLRQLPSPPDSQRYGSTRRPKNCSRPMAIGHRPRMGYMLAGF